MIEVLVKMVKQADFNLLALTHLQQWRTWGDPCGAHKTPGGEQERESVLPGIRLKCRSQVHTDTAWAGGGGGGQRQGETQCVASGRGLRVRHCPGMSPPPRTESGSTLV